MNSDRIKNSSGVMWSAIERFALQGSQVIVTLIVARLLIPADYGLIAMMTIFIAFSVSLIDNGMAQALVQRLNRSEEDLSTALIFNLTVAAALYSIIYISAPYIAEFYNTPELCKVARIYSLTLITNSTSVVQQALITISLDFKRQATASLTGILIGGAVSIYMAYMGYGVWALVAQQLISAVVYNAILWIRSPWRPRSGFSWESFRVLSSFGSKIMVTGLINTIYTNMYALIIGKQFASKELGLYNRATTIAALPSNNISTIVNRALFPILCRVQHSPDEAAATLLRYMSVICFVVFPTMVGICITARPFTLTLLGERWIEVVPFLQFISIAYMWDPVMVFCGSVIRSQGRPADSLRAEIIKKICGVTILIASIRYGVIAMCGGLILYSILDMTIIILFTRKISPSLSHLNILRQLAPTIALTAAMGGVVWYAGEYTSSLNPIIELAILTAIGAATYLLLAIVTRRPELRYIVEIIKEITGKK